MTRRQETGMAVIAVVVIILLLLLTSCNTKKTVTEYIYVHDTTEVRHSDTIRDIKVVRDTIIDRKVIANHDTIHHEIERLIVVNEHGDTVKQLEWDRLWQKVHELEMSHHNESHSDSASYLKAERDSLKQALVEEKQKKKVVYIEKTPWKLVLITLAAVIITILLIIREVKKKIAEMRNRT